MRLESSFCYSSPDASLCVSAPLSGERVWISWQAARLRCSLQQKSPSCVALICSPPPLLLSIQSFRKGLKQSRFNRRCTSPTRSDSGSTTQGSVSPPLVSSPLHTLLRPSPSVFADLIYSGSHTKEGEQGGRREAVENRVEEWKTLVPPSSTQWKFSSFLETKDCTSKVCKKSLYAFFITIF